jgi:hypothetical protein
MAIGRTDYEERKEQKIDAFETRARKARKEAELFNSQALNIMHAIPLGQPILVGHHSEKRHRADLKRIDSGFKRSSEANEKADYYLNRAATAASNCSISADDPDALEQYQKNLDERQAMQERMKAVNAYWRKNKTMKGFNGLTAEEADNIDEKMKTASPYELANGYYGAYTLTNNSAEIRRIKKQIEKLKKLDAMEDEKIIFSFGTLLINTEINRVQFIFDDIPPEKIRTILKMNSFKWSPREKAWQRIRTLNAVSNAKRLVSYLESKKE